MCFQNLNVKIVGMGSGLSWSSLGPTHHTTEDISVLRAIPNLMILSPATPNQVRACVRSAYEHPGPVYLKIGMNQEREFFAEDYQLPQNGVDVLREGKDLAIFVTGSILEETMRAAELLAQDGIEARLLHVTTLKPFSQQAVLQAAGETQRIVTVEEHNIYGGLGSLAAEALAYNGIGAHVLPIGMQDCFAKGYGTHAAVRRANQLDGAQIYKKIREVWP